jgi:hypothetical protein
MNVQVRAPEYGATGLLPDFIEYHRVLEFEESNIVWESITGDKAVVLASPPKWILCFYPKGISGVPLSSFLSGFVPKVAPGVPPACGSLRKAFWRWFRLPATHAFYGVWKEEGGKFTSRAMR